MFIYIFFSILLISAIWALYLSFVFGKKKKLWTSRISYYRNKITLIEKEDYYKQIIQYDSILSNILKDLWYSWWLGEQLKKKPQIISWKLNEIWELHKLRNKIAHELWNTSEDILKKSAIKYKNILFWIL